MKKILFPIDFSPRAFKALQQAINFAQLLDAELIIYHTYNRPLSINPDPDAQQLANELYVTEKKIEKKFDKIQAENTQLQEIKYSFCKELGVFVEKIIHYIKSNDIDLIVMATKGATGFDELWGTKTADITKSVKVPVLVIPDNTKTINFQKIGLVCDYSKEVNYDSLDFLVDILKLKETEVDVINLNHKGKTLTKEETSNRLLVKNKLESIPTDFHYTFNNNIDEGVINYAKSNNFGVIAVLPKNYSFIRKVFHESLSKKMVFKSPVPLLILK